MFKTVRDSMRSYVAVHFNVFFSNFCTYIFVILLQGYVCRPFIKQTYARNYNDDCDDE